MALSERVALACTILTDIIYLNLATADESGTPWCTPLFTAYDEHYVFYWASAQDARHSQNIRANGRAAVTVYDSRIEEGKGEAVYVEGTAAELTPETCDKGLSALRQHAKLADLYFTPQHFKILGPMRIYAFTPRQFYMLQPDGADLRMSIDILNGN